MLPSLLLRRVCNPNGTLNSVLKLRFSKFLKGEILPLYQELCKDQDNFVPKSYKKSAKSHSLSRIQWLAAENSPSKALSVLTSSGVAPVNDRSHQLMSEKHPNVDEHDNLWDINSQDVNDFTLQPFTSEMCLTALKSFDRSTGSGPSNMRVSYILDCVLAEPWDNSSLMDLWSKVLHILASGNAPNSISSFVSGAKLIALEKPKLLDDGLPDLRPIAVGELIRRWVGKILISTSKPQITKFFHPFQLGVGKKCGAEIIHRAVKCKLDLNPNLIDLLDGASAIFPIIISLDSLGIWF
jgi:hypothetical protein